MILRSCRIHLLSISKTTNVTKSTGYFPLPSCTYLHTNPIINMNVNTVVLTCIPLYIHTCKLTVCPPPLHTNYSSTTVVYPLVNLIQYYCTVIHIIHHTHHHHHTLISVTCTISQSSSNYKFNNTNIVEVKFSYPVTPGLSLIFCICRKT